MPDVTTKVHRARADGVTWQEVLAVAASCARSPEGRLMGFFYAADCARWFILGEGGGPNPAPVDPDRVFELRAFDGTSEWRWVRDGEAGQASWISVSASARPSGNGWHDLEILECASSQDLLRTSFLLWGQMVSGKATPGFVQLQENRLGSFEVPEPSGAPPSEGARVVIEVEEYFGRGDRHGNCQVLEERWVGLDWAPVPEGKSA